MLLRDGRTSRVSEGSGGWLLSLVCRYKAREEKAEG